MDGDTAVGEVRVVGGGADCDRDGEVTERGVRRGEEGFEDGAAT